MRLNVRNIAAQCPKCGADDFAAGSGKRFELASQTTMALSAATLEQIRKRRGK